MKKSLMLKCKICDTEEEIIGISFKYYMLYHFVPNGIGEICENCGNNSLFPVKSKTMEHCEHGRVKDCEYCNKRLVFQKNSAFNF